ncbi:hypothetical protein BGZ63DRAFT_362543 [Mariannaea sp. PMI_226]|nr:hypothetical protein BGZ63DRAFT_362543 [Mariannaea sp. PMI_226]
MQNSHKISSLESHSTLSPYSILYPGTSPHLDIDNGPLNEQGKAELFRYFVTNIGPALDAYDPNKYFTEIIPSQATLSLPLLEVILTVSAWHSRATKRGPWKSTKFDMSLHPVVLSSLDGDALDVGLILHQFLLNMDGTSSCFINSNPIPTYNFKSPIISVHFLTFHDNILWARLRQEIFMSISNQEPLTLSSDQSGLEHMARTRDDRARANQMLIGLMDIVQYCFGSDKNTYSYDKLVESSSTWMMTNPSSFSPVMIRRRQAGDVFPEIWFLNDCVAAGLQYFHLARILLVVYDPRVPQLCRARKQASQWIEAQTKNDLEIICGIADSISSINPMHITACMAISMVGDRFTNSDQQHALYDILVKTTKTYGLPTESV